MSSSVFQFLKHIFQVFSSCSDCNFLPWKIVTWKTTVPLPLPHTAWKGWIPGSLAETPWGNSSFKTSIKICLFWIYFSMKFSKEMRPEKLLFQARFNNWPTNSERFPIPLLNPPIIKTLSLNTPFIKTLSKLYLISMLNPYIIIILSFNLPIIKTLSLNPPFSNSMLNPPTGCLKKTEFKRNQLWQILLLLARNPFGIFEKS